MLSWSQQFKQYVVLRTYTHKLPNRLEIGEHIHSEALCFPLRWLVQACEHGDERGFTGTVVPEQHKDLVDVHFQVEPLHSLHSTGVCLA